MTAAFDNSAAALPGCIRDAVTGAYLRINSDGSINLTSGGVRDTSGTTATVYDWIPGTVRDPSTGKPMAVAADGSIKVA